MKTEKLQEK